MSDFQLDTSGAVYLIGLPQAETFDHDLISWADLSPFVQGCVEAALSKPFEKPFPLMPVYLGFSDLAPATLAQMIADCERLLVSKGVTDGNIHEGRNFWTLRQGDYYASEDFPPLTLTLGDDGLVYAT